MVSGWSWKTLDHNYVYQFPQVQSLGVRNRRKISLLDVTKHALNCVVDRLFQHWVLSLTILKTSLNPVGHRQHKGTYSGGHL